METPNLYESLGVAPTASTATIKAAFRRLAKDRHPDHGGDPEDFRLLKLAYDVLSDPEQRRHYDTTGETPGDRAARAAEDNKFLAMASEFMLTIVAQSGAPQFNDIPELARAAVAQQIQNTDAQLRSLALLMSRILEVCARLRAPEGEDRLNDIFQHKLSDLAANIEQTKAQRARWVRLQQLLQDYRYEVHNEYVP